MLLLQLSALLAMGAVVRAGSQCSTGRSNGLQFNVRSQVNGTGQRIVTGDVQGAAQETGTVGVSVDHWTAMCDGSEFVAFTFSVDVPSGVPSGVSAVTGVLATSSSAPALSCPLGYETLSGVGCYKELTLETTREQARQTCEAEGALLAVPESQRELDLFKAIWNRPGRGLWLGIKKTGGAWRTDEGSGNFMGWSAAEPGLGGECVAMFNDGFGSRPCAALGRAICERRLH